MFQEFSENQKDRPTILDEKYKHTLYHVMHGKDDKPCPFIYDESLQVHMYPVQVIQLRMCIATYVHTYVYT